VKFTLNILEKRNDTEDQHWPAYIFGGRMRTSTLVLIIVFLATWWLYSAYRPQEDATHNAPQTPQVVPPGFVPDPNYTWVPRSKVQQPPATVTFTPTPTTTEPPPPPPPTTTTTTPPPPFVLPTPPCLLPPPFCPPSTTPTTPPPPLLPQPGPGPVPTSRPPTS
jgi:hypothetical protein